MDAAPEKWGIFGKFSRLPTQKKILIIIVIVIVIVLFLLILSLSQEQARGSIASDMSLEEKTELAVSCIAGVTDARAVITYGGETESVDGITGVVIAVKGARDVAVKLRVMRAVRTLLDVDADKIEIFEMNETGATP